MIRIDELDVTLEVQGDGDEAAFARLFSRYIRRWAEEQDRRRARARSLRADSALGDLPSSSLDEER